MSFFSFSSLHLINVHKTSDRKIIREIILGKVAEKKVAKKAEKQINIELMQIKIQIRFVKSLMIY